MSCDPLGHVKDRHNMTENEDLIVQSTRNDWLLAGQKIVFLRASKIHSITRRADMPPFMLVKTD